MYNTTLPDTESTECHCAPNFCIFHISSANSSPPYLISLARASVHGNGHERFLLHAAPPRVRSHAPERSKVQTTSLDFPIAHRHNCVGTSTRVEEVKNLRSDKSSSGATRMFRSCIDSRADPCPRLSFQFSKKVSTVMPPHTPTLLTFAGFSTIFILQMHAILFMLLISQILYERVTMEMQILQMVSPSQNPPSPQTCH